MKDEGTLLLASRDEELVSRIRGLNGSLPLGVEAVDRGEEALARIGDARLLMLDDDLADLRGRSLIRTIRSARPDLKIVFTASDVSQDLEVEVRRSGAYFYLPKPVSLEIFRKVAAKAVEHESTRNRWKMR